MSVSRGLNVFGLLGLPASSHAAWPSLQHNGRSVEGRRMPGGATRPHPTASSYEGLIQHVKAFLSPGEASFFQ